MDDTTAAKHVAAHTSCAAAQAAALRIPALRKHVLGNPSISDEAFKEVFTAKTPLPTARKAVKRQMSEAQMLHVLHVDNRPDVVVAMVRNSMPTRAVLDALVAKDLLDVTEKTVFANRYGEKRDPMKVRDALLREWAQQLPVDWLAGLTPAQAGRLQLLRLMKDDTLDTDVVRTALNTFDEWGSNYDAPLLQWVLVMYPHVVDQLASGPVASSAVQTTLAGSHLFGRLTADQQAAVLDLNELKETASKERDRLGADWFEQRKFAWMAAGSNPTTHREVLERLIEPLDQTSETYASRTVTKRLSHFWRVDSFESASDPVHRSTLVQHVSPDAKKKAGRPHSLPALVANPTLTLDEAATIARYVLRMDGYTPTGWTHPLVRAAFAEMEARFDLSPLGDAANPLTAWWDERVAAPRQLRSANVDEIADMERNVDAPVHHLDWEYAAETRYWLERAIGDNVEAWYVLYQLLPTFEGTVRDFASVVTAMAA